LPSILYIVFALCKSSLHAHSKGNYFTTRERTATRTTDIVRLMNAPAQPRYRHSKLVQPTNESTYLNILSLYPPGLTLRLISQTSTTGFVLPVLKFFFSYTLSFIFISYGPASLLSVFSAAPFIPNLSLSHDFNLS